MRKMLLCMMLLFSIPTFAEETVHHPSGCSSNTLVGVGGYGVTFTVPPNCTFMKIWAQAPGGNSWAWSSGQTGGSGGGGACWKGIVMSNVAPGDQFNWTAASAQDFTGSGQFVGTTKLVKGTSSTITQQNLVLIMGSGGSGGGALDGQGGAGGAGGVYGQTGGNGIAYLPRGQAHAGGGWGASTLGGNGGDGSPDSLCVDGGVGLGGYSSSFSHNGHGQGGDGGPGFYQGGGGAKCSYVSFPPGSASFGAGGGGGGSSKKGEQFGFDWIYDVPIDGAWNLPGCMGDPTYVPPYGQGALTPVSSSDSHLGGGGMIRISFSDLTFAESDTPPGPMSVEQACTDFNTIGYTVNLTTHPCNSPTLNCRGDYDANGVTGPGTDAICSYFCHNNQQRYVFRVGC